MKVFAVVFAAALVARGACSWGSIEAAASGVASKGTRKTVSPLTRRASRVVARIVLSGHRR